IKPSCRGRLSQLPPKKSKPKGSSTTGAVTSNATITNVSRPVRRSAEGFACWRSCFNCRGERITLRPFILNQIGVIERAAQTPNCAMNQVFGSHRRRRNQLQEFFGLNKLTVPLDQRAKNC